MSNKREQQNGQLKPISVGKLEIPVSADGFSYVFPCGMHVRCPLKAKSLAKKLHNKLFGFYVNNY